MKKCCWLFCFLFTGFFAVDGTAQSANRDTARNSVSPPIRFLSFKALRSDANIYLEFTTPSESINSYYQIESSLDGANWKSLAKMTAQGNINPVNKYDYKDQDVNQKLVYYRVRQVFNNMSSFSPVVMVKAKAVHENIRIYGVTGNALSLYFPAQMKCNVVFQLYTLNGQSLMTQTLVKPFGNIVIPTDYMAKGTVIVSLSDGQNNFNTRQVIFR